MKHKQLASTLMGRYCRMGGPQRTDRTSTSAVLPQRPIPLRSATTSGGPPSWVSAEVIDEKCGHLGRTLARSKCPSACDELSGYHTITTTFVPYSVSIREPSYYFSYCRAKIFALPVSPKCKAKVRQAKSIGVLTCTPYCEY